jgi:diguanylate cyclase (GGDEF)-like protein/PAS domain S-box-containing protein
MAVMWWRWLAVLSFAVPVLAGAAPLRVVTTDNFPPYVIRNASGELEGYTVDVWRLWQQKTGIPVELTVTSWAHAQQQILAGQADVIDLIFKTPQRAPLYDFSPAFAEVHTAIYADASIPGLHDIQSLAGFVVGVEDGDACVEVLRRAGIGTLRSFADHAQLADAAASQNIKIFCMDDYPADYYLYRLGMQKKFIKAFDLYHDQFRRAVRKGDAATLATVNTGMALITPAEEAALREKWMGRPLVFTEYASRLGQLLLALAAVILGLLAWLYSVRKAVRRRTVELEEEKVRLRTVLENSPDVIWMKDTKGRYLGCNRRGERLLGKTEDQILGKTDFDLFDKAGAEQYRHSDQRALEARGPLVEEERVVFQDSGETHWFETIRTAVVKPDGALLGILGVARDVTVRRLHERTIHEQDVLLKEMSALARIGAWEFDLVNGHVTWTDEVARIHETAPGQERSIPTCLSYYHGESRVRVEQALTRAIATGGDCDLEIEMITDRGNRKWVRAICRTMVEEGKVVKVRGTLQDITERRRLEESMRMANLIYQTSSEAIAVTDAANQIVDVNPAYLRQTGCDADEVLGRKPGMFSSDMHDSAFYERIWQEVALRDHWQGEIWDRHLNGKLTARFVNIRAIHDPDGKVFRHVIQFTDITEQKLKDELIWKQTNFDALTGLPNRRLFVDRLEQEIKKAQGTGAALGVMYIDLDRFKEINDTFGRSKGDRVLLEIGRRIAHSVPEAATLARIGGDSFALAMGGVERRLHLETLAETLIEAVGAPLVVDGGERAYVSASVGIALFPDDAGQAEDLIRNAEQATAMAKKEGRARFSYFSRSLQREALATLLLANDLRQALARRELQLFYQPIVEVASGRICKAEALLRWSHPVHGTISPARFIPLAEETGLILEIGEWVVDEAIASIQRWRQRYGSLVEVSVNNSPMQFEQPGHCPWLDRLVRSGLPPQCLTVEITEGVLVKDSDLVRGCLQRMREVGAKVSIDDFGTGFSALSYLKHFDVDYLKIDKSFVANLIEDDSDQALTEAIINMAHKLGIQTIAEGVESGAQRDLLARYGCDYLQGYLYSRPVPREIFELMLAPQAAHPPG